MDHQEQVPEIMNENATAHATATEASPDHVQAVPGADAPTSESKSRMNSRERATERANEVKERLVQAGSRARKRFADTKLGQRVEQTVSQLETKFPDLKTNLQNRAEERLSAFAQTASEAGDLARNVAKAQVDQVLLNLQHKGLDLSQSNELVQKIGKTVLRRADEVREKLEGSPMAPEWLKDLKLGDKIEGLSQKLSETLGTASGQDIEAAAGESKSAAQAGVESTTTADAVTSKAAAEMQPEVKPKRAAKFTDSETAAAASDVDTLAPTETVTKTSKSAGAKSPKKSRTNGKH